MMTAWSDAEEHQPSKENRNIAVTIQRFLVPYEQNCSSATISHCKIQSVRIRTEIDSFVKGV
jgi:hypothetical protein